MIPYHKIRGPAVGGGTRMGNVFREKLDPLKMISKRGNF